MKTEVGVGHYFWGVRLVLRMRFIVALLLVAVATTIGLTQAVTVSSILIEPGIPPTRVGLFLACFGAGCQLLLLRGVLPDFERMSAISIRSFRFTIFATVQVFTFLVIVMTALTRSAGNWDSALRAAAMFALLSGLALLAGAWSSFAGLALPWLYVVSGLALGYDSPLAGGAANVKPWAWIVDDSSSNLLTIAVAVALTATAAILGPLRVDQANGNA